MDKDDAVFYALLKFGRVCPDASFVGRPKAETEQRQGLWIVKVRHYHNVLGKQGKEHTFRYWIKVNKDEAEFGCGPSSP